MRRCLALALMVLLSWIGGLAQDARAGVTLDILFEDATVPSGITISPGDPFAPGCTFSGYAGQVVTGVRCMDVILKSTPVPSLSATGVAVLGVAVIGIGIAGLVIAAQRRFNGR
jgi:hypothetical protein